MNTSKLNVIFELAHSCMLPALKDDLDAVLLKPEHFERYHVFLREELPRLYDLLQHHEDIWLECKEPELNKIRAWLLLLFCELTASGTAYKLESRPDLVNHGEQLLSKLIILCSTDMEPHIFNYYRENLNKNSWKRQLGAVHGYDKYLEKRFADNKMATDYLNLSLAVGLNIRESHEIVYKQLGIHIFSLLLTNGIATDIQNLNIHSVIYDNVFHDVYHTDTIETSKPIWECLLLCLDHFNHIDNFAWNQCDDLLERLIEKIPFTSDAKTTIYLLQVITKIAYFYTINRNDIETILMADLSQPDILSHSIEMVVAGISSCVTSYRWAKSILEMFVLTSNQLLQSIEICEEMLQELLRCYMICILPIPVQALQAHLPEFYSKFMSLLLESQVQHKNAPSIGKLTHRFLDLFEYQLREISSRKLHTNMHNSNLNHFIVAFQSLRLNCVEIL